MWLAPAGFIRTGGHDPRGFLGRLGAPARANLELSMLWSLFTSVVTFLPHSVSLLSLSNDVALTPGGDVQPPCYSPFFNCWWKIITPCSKAAQGSRDSFMWCFPCACWTDNVGSGQNHGNTQQRAGNGQPCKGDNYSGPQTSKGQKSHRFMMCLLSLFFFFSKFDISFWYEIWFDIV